MSSPTAPTATNRLGVRDLATIGIFTALLFVLSIVTGTVTSLHPMVYPFNPALLALLGPCSTRSSSRACRRGEQRS